MEKFYDLVWMVWYELLFDELVFVWEWNGDEVIDYGFWWYEMVEFMLWM